MCSLRAPPRKPAPGPRWPPHTPNARRGSRPRAGPGIAGLYGLEGSVNVTGDDQKKLDMVAHHTFVSALKVRAARTWHEPDTPPTPSRAPPPADPARSSARCSSQFSNELCVMVSEEEEDPIVMAEHESGARRSF